MNETDSDKRAGYTVDLQEGNYENKWQAAEDNPGNFDENPLLISVSVTTNMNGERQNPSFRVLNTVHNTQRRSSVIKYGIRGQALLLNQWQDAYYFTSAFPMLFPTGVGGHYDKRDVPVSLVAFADWALRHHSRGMWLPLIVVRALTD